MNPTDFLDAYRQAQEDIALETTLDVNLLLQHAHNQDIQTKSLAQIAQENFDVLSELDLAHDTLQAYCRKLVDYEYTEDVDDLVLGKYVRWIRIPTSDLDADPKLVTGGKLMSVRFQDNGTFVVVFAGNRVTQYRFDHFLTFQKLSEEEQLILYSLGQETHIG